MLIAGINSKKDTFVVFGDLNHEKLTYAQMATTTFQEIDKLANLYNKTKDDKYKILWYKKIKEWANVKNTFI